MFDLKKILLPVDFSERCVGAARDAAMLACRFQAKVIMLHVVQSDHRIFMSAEMGDVYDWRPEQWARARKEMDSFQVDEFRGITTDRIVVEGDPAVHIVQAAHDERADLIVIPTHGYGVFRRFILGSVTAKVLHDADCPVLTGVHLHDKPILPTKLFRNVLCAIDLGPQSEKVLAWAAGLAGELGARLDIVHALPPLDVGEDRFFNPEIQLAMERDARERISELQEKARINVETTIDSGEPVKVVRHTADSIGADVVVIGRHVGAGILGRLRAHAYGIIRESPCPVISV